MSVNPHDIDYHSGSIGLPVPSVNRSQTGIDDDNVKSRRVRPRALRERPAGYADTGMSDAIWMKSLKMAGCMGDIAVMDEDGFLRIG